MLFPYSTAGKPLLPLTLTLGTNGLLAEGLLDSGCDVNVLPLGIGSALGAQWDPRRTTLRLAGAFAGTAAIPLLVMAQVGDLARVRLAFAWCETNELPLILGQTNFFMEFDICFFRSRNQFSVLPRGGGGTTL
jgi:hypothetical protein